MSLGRLAYRLFYSPTLPYRYKLKHFGLKGWTRYAVGEYQMKKAARSLTTIRLRATEDPLISLNFLSGARYWHQTIYCIQSLYIQCGSNISVTIYSDGSITDDTAKIFSAFCPEIKIIGEAEVLESINRIIPKEKFPTLHYLREWHPFFKRMIDIHCNSNWKVHLDSDMLFFKFPTDLIHNYRAKKACYMEEQLGYSYFVDNEDSLKSKYKITTVPNVNGGIVGYDGSIIDYNDLENKAKLLVENYSQLGPASIEQTLMSYILSNQGAEPLNKNEYKIHYNNLIGEEDSTVRHYIFKSKLPYLTKEWKNIV